MIMENTPDLFLGIMIAATFLLGFIFAFILQSFNDRSYRIGVMDGRREIMLKNSKKSCKNCE